MTPKIWGNNIELFRNSSVSVNRMNVLAGTACSWHFHQTKYNIFHVISGRLMITTEDDEVILNPGDTSKPIPPGMNHCFFGVEDTVAIEVMYVEYNNDDIQRIRIGINLLGRSNNQAEIQMGEGRENCNVWKRLWWVIRCPHPLSNRKVEFTELWGLIKRALRYRFVR